MICKRPTIPFGHSLAGLPAVNKALHSDSYCELYTLATVGSNASSLFLVRSLGDYQSEKRRLLEWWATLPTQVLSVVQVLAADESPTNFICAVLTLPGRCLEQPLTDAKQDSLLRLFYSMLEAIEASAAISAFPDFNPSLSWLAADGLKMGTLLPINSAAQSEVDQVRMVAKSFYRFATGIEPDLTKASAPSFLGWSKFGGEELARTIDKCLAPTNSKTSITTFDALSKALGRKGAVPGGQGNSASESEEGVPISPKGRGLDKVAGMHSLKDLLRRDVVEPIRNPTPYARYGLSIPNGILLYGPPGCGKTYIARLLAEELGHYFVEIIPSELASPFVHQSVIRIRQLFDDAAEHAPSIVFIYEFEALVPPRNELGGHQQYKAEEVNEFLAHLNSCSEKKIFVIAATNQPDKIDPAVRRTGRLDKLIYVGPPDAEARREMLALHLSGRPVAADLDLGATGEMLEGYSASDLRFLVDEAARHALKNQQVISADSFRFAVSRVQRSVPKEMEVQYLSIEQRGF